MAILLHIDTATEHASVGISNNGQLLAIANNTIAANHAAFVQPAIKDICQTSGIGLQSIDAIAVSNGPGSYTGLRVGLASAKGLCYALNKPLITLNSLTIMAHAVKLNIQEEKNALICPLIDARRNDVFTALYTQDLTEVLPPQHLVLNEQSFAQTLATQAIYGIGSGAGKLQQLINHPRFFISPVQWNVRDMIDLAEQAFANQQFADIAYAIPFYLKEVYTTIPKKTV